MTSRKFLVLIVSFILALFASEMIFPTPNAVHGGTAKMFSLIFLTVGFKAAIEFAFSRWRKRKPSKQQDDSLL